MNEHPNSLKDGMLINIAQLIIVQWYLITQQPILKIDGWGFWTFDLNTFLFFFVNGYALLKIKKNIDYWTFPHLFDHKWGFLKNKKLSNIFFGNKIHIILINKINIVCVWSLTCPIIGCTSIAHGKICEHSQETKYKFLNPYLRDFILLSSNPNEGL